MSLRERFPENIEFENDPYDTNTLLLIAGYIKLIKINKQIIPTSIIRLIIKFYYYHSKLLIFYLKQNRNDCIPPIIIMAELDNNKHSKCIIKPLNDSYNDRGIRHRMDTRNNCTYYVRDFDIPSNILSGKENDKLLNNRLYDIIFSIGTGKHGNEHIGYIIDTKNIGSDISLNAYYWILPKTSSCLQSASSIYSAKHGLISIVNNDFCILTFNQEKEIEHEWKWKEFKIGTDRYFPSITMISDDKLFCCGADVDQTEIYDFNTKIWTKAANMKHEQYNSAICFDKFTTERVYIAGGDGPDHRLFDYFDITKNAWYSLPEISGDHYRYPIIWMDNKNVINIASTHCGLFERFDIRENVWNVYKKYDDKSMDNLFGIKIEIDDYKSRFII